MINRLGSYLALRPRRAAILVLTLAVAFILVLAGLALELSHFGRAPYPSEEFPLPLSLVNGNVVFTQEYTDWWYNQTSNTTSPIETYTGAKIAFGIVGWGSRTSPFGNESQLSAGAPNDTMNQSIWESSFVNVTIEITDSTGDGAFGSGDTILFKIVPLSEDTVHYMGLAFFPRGNSPTTYMEMSFAIHDGKLYTWFSHNLSTEEPWWFNR